MEVPPSLKELVQKTKATRKVSIVELFRELGLTAPAELMIDDLVVEPQPKGWAAEARFAKDPGWTIPIAPFLNARFFDLKLLAVRANGSSSATFEGKMDLGRSVLLDMKYVMPGDVAFTGSFGRVSMRDLLEMFGPGIDLPRNFDLTFEENFARIEKKAGAYEISGGTKTLLGDLKFLASRDGGKWFCRFEGTLTRDPNVAFGFMPALGDFIGVAEPFFRVTTLGEPFITIKGKFRSGSIAAKWWPELLDQIGVSVDRGNSVEVEVYSQLKRCKAKIPLTSPTAGFEGTFGVEYADGGNPSVFVEGTWSTSFGKFDVRGAAEGFGFVISGSMREGSVTIPGFGTLRNLGLTLGINISGIPSFGFAGTFDSKAFEMSVAFFANSAEPSKSMVVAAMDKVSLKDVLTTIAGVRNVPFGDVFEQVAIRPSKSFQFGPELAAALDARDSDKCDRVLNTQGIGDVVLEGFGSSELRVFVNDPGQRWHFTRLMPSKKLFHYSAKKTAGGVQVDLMGQLYFAPEKVTIGNIGFEQGMWVKARVELFMLRGSIDAEVIKEKGIRAQVLLDPVIIGSSDFIALTDASKTDRGPSLAIGTYDNSTDPDPSRRGRHAFVSGALWVLRTQFARANLEASKDGAVLLLAAKLQSIAGLTPSIDVNLRATITSEKRASIGGSASMTLTSGILEIAKLGKINVGVAIEGAVDRGATVAAHFSLPGVPGSMSTPAIPLTVPLGGLDQFLLGEINKAAARGLGVDGYIDLVKRTLGAVPGAKETIEALLKYFGRSLTDAVKTVKNLGSAAGDVANALMQLGKDPKESLKSLLEAGYSLKDAALSVKEHFAATPELIVEVATAVYGGVTKITEAVVGEITGVMKDVYNLDGAAIGRKLQNAGYAVSQIATTLHKHLLWTAEETANFLKNALNAGRDAVDSALSAAGYAAGEINKVLGKLWDIIDFSRW